MDVITPANRAEREMQVQAGMCRKSRVANTVKNPCRMRRTQQNTEKTMRNAEVNTFLHSAAGTLFCYKTPQKPMRKQKQSSIPGEQSAKTRVSAHASKGNRTTPCGGRRNDCQQEQEQEEEEQQQHKEEEQKQRQYQQYKTTTTTTVATTTTTTTTTTSTTAQKQRQTTTTTTTRYTRTLRTHYPPPPTNNNNNRCAEGELCAQRPQSSLSWLL